MLVAWVGVAAAEPLTLADAVREAMDHNPELRLAAVDREQARLEVVAVAGRFDPVLGASVDVGSSTSPTNTSVDGTSVLVSRSSGFTTQLDQALPTGGTASLGWSETYASSNSANVVSASTVYDRVSLAVSQPLLSGFGATLRGVRNARLASDDAALALRQQQEQLVLDVSAAYWGLVSARESLELAARSRAIAQQQVDDAHERYAEGFAGSGDVNQVERALGSARQSEVIASAEVEAAEQALERILGRAVGSGEPVPVDQPVVAATSPTVDEVLAAAREANTGWLRERLAYERARLGVRSARIDTLPDVRVNGSIGASGLATSASEARADTVAGTYTGWSLGASASLPLPARSLRAGLASAALDLEAARVRLEAAEQDLVLRVESAVRATARDRERVALAEETVRFARLALAADEELLNDGKGSARDVVLSLDALDQATAGELLARIDLQASLLELDRVAGRLVTE